MPQASGGQRAPRGAADHLALPRGERPPFSFRAKSPPMCWAPSPSFAAAAGLARPAPGDANSYFSTTTCCRPEREAAYEPRMFHLIQIVAKGRASALRLVLSFIQFRPRKHLTMLACLLLSRATVVAVPQPPGRRVAFGPQSLGVGSHSRAACEGWFDAQMDTFQAGLQAQPDHTDGGDEDEHEGDDDGELAHTNMALLKEGWSVSATINAHEWVQTHLGKRVSVGLDEAADAASDVRAATVVAHLPAAVEDGEALEALYKVEFAPLYGTDTIGDGVLRRDLDEKEMQWALSNGT